jgi:lipoate-protein ligase A
MAWRLVDSGASAGALNMGLDEAVLRGVAAGRSPPTLRLYRWSPRCVSVGYFQSLVDEVDLGSCAQLGIDAVRRVTGGGAVYHDAEITYSVIMPEGGPLSPPDILESYRLICSGVIAGIGELGVEASFAPINDIVAGGKKVSGNAQTRREGCLLQHGTVLLGLDLETMFSILRIPAEKLKGRLIEDAKARVTSLGSILGRDVAYGEAALAMTAGFAEAFGHFGVEFEPGELGAGEIALGRTLAEEKYSKSEWNARR